MRGRESNFFIKTRKHARAYCTQIDLKKILCEKRIVLIMVADKFQVFYKK